MIWGIFILEIDMQLNINIWLALIIIGSLNIPFCKWFIGIRWLDSIWTGYLISTVSIVLSILLVDFWINYSPDGMTQDIRPILQPLFSKLTFIRNEYDMNDFNMLLRVTFNSLLSIIFLWIIDKFKRLKSNSSQQQV
jgi:hypothetical protein